MDKAKKRDQLIREIANKYGSKIDTEDGCLDMIDKLGRRISYLAHVVAAGDANPLEMMVTLAIYNATCEQLNELAQDRPIQ